VRDLPDFGEDGLTFNLDARHTVRRYIDPI